MPNLRIGSTHPLPYVWPICVPFWSAYAWSLAAELPFLLKRRPSPSADAPDNGPDVQDGGPDRGSMRVVLWAGALAIPLSFTFAGLLRSAAMTTDAHALPVYVAGVALVLAGGLLRRHCFKMLGSSFTYDVRVSTGQTVVERGAYRFVRHPSYTAGLLLFAGIGLALGNWASLAVSVIPLGFAYSYRISVEERALLAALGPAYADYMRRTYRLVPFVF